ATLSASVHPSTIALRHPEPPRRSTRLSSLGETLSAVAARRRSGPRRLGQAMRGELDWIVMKAMEKDRNRPYETANDFASDVMRSLTDQAVQACPPSAWSRARKFAIRNRKGLAAVALATVSGLIVVSILGVWQLEHASRVRQL